MLIISLIQGHTYDLIDGEFANWKEAECKWNITSFFQMTDFQSKAFKKKIAKFVVLRKLFDWTSYFEDTFTDFSQYSNARLFKFSKNESGKIVMMYKTNPLETEWRGFKAPNSTKEHGIQICKIFKQTPLHMIVPELISQNITKILTIFIPIIKYYNSLDSTFWHHLYQDSTHYLHSNDLFPGESKLYN